MPWSHRVAVYPPGMYDILAYCLENPEQVVPITYKTEKEAWTELCRFGGFRKAWVLEERHLEENFDNVSIKLDKENKNILIFQHIGSIEEKGPLLDQLEAHIAAQTNEKD